MPQTGDISDCPHPPLRCGSVHTQRGHNHPPRYVLAQGPEVDHKLLLSYAHRDTFGGVVPPTRFPPGHPPAKAGGAHGGLFPPQGEPGDRPPSPLFPLALGVPSP